jgi:hypothetical protein
MATAVNQSSFPDVLECSSGDSVLRGQYKLLSSSVMSSYLNFVVEPANKLMYVYSRTGTKSVYLVYCEGVPELLPADIWETVVAEALSRHAEANMAIAVRGAMSIDVCRKVCADLQQIALEVSQELVGWLIVSAGSSHMVPLARCIQRLPEDQFLLKNAFGSVEITNAPWEVRDSSANIEFVPEWLNKGLDAKWIALLTQTGLFKKDEAFNLRPPPQPPVLTQPIPLSTVKRQTSAQRMPTVFETPLDCLSGARTSISPAAGIIDHVGPGRYVWNLIGSSVALDKLSREFHGMSSAPFATEQGQRFIIEILPVNEGGLITITLRRHNFSALQASEPIRFKISLGAGQSGVKVLPEDNSDFTVVLDPRAVFGTAVYPSRTDRITLLKRLSLIIEFVSPK